MATLTSITGLRSISEADCWRALAAEARDRGADLAAEAYEAAARGCEPCPACGAPSRQVEFSQGGGARAAVFCGNCGAEA